MIGERYAAATAIAARLHDRLDRYQAAPRDGPEALAPVPDAATVDALVEAAFWASLRREEGYEPRISLAFLSPGDTTHPLIFERAFPLGASALTKVAPAVERPGIHLGVWATHEGLRVWGTTRALPKLCFVVEVAAPGLLVVKLRRGDERDKYANVAVLEGDRIKIVDEHALGPPACHALLRSLMGVDSPVSWGSSANVLVRFALAMRAHGRGGSLLVVPASGESWRESILRPIQYAVAPPFSELSYLIQLGPDERTHPDWHAAVGRAVEMLAGLTAVDGATVISERCELFAFGAKITRRDGGAPVERIALTEPIEGAATAMVHPAELGGTRHLSAAQFVHDQPGAVALVASQDGRFTVFTWSARDAVVHAQRVEMLLL